MPDAQIFKATYSGIPVYEMMCKGVAVMRRRSDSWLNATQILKVAGFDKPQRTRVLEREVQKGEHEKVQGGYGKYQGTWIPLERGLQLAKQYKCEHILRPIIDFQPASTSPPLAPKHLVATSTPSRTSRRKAADTTKRASRKKVLSDEGEAAEAGEESDDGSLTHSISRASSSSRTPSPIGSPASDRTGKPSSRRSKRDELHDDNNDSLPNTSSDPRSYGDEILEYFISDSTQVPPILINPPPEFDPDMAIDDDGHTALHWACAMGRIRVMKLLLSAGADIFKVNKAGQTALMRSVMFANNYDVRKFPDLYELLHRSTLNIDNYNRTVFHHIVDVAMTKGKTHAARYYMETVLNRLSEFPRELADVINFQDEDGETALTMAARCRSKRLVKLLIDHGADVKIVNNDGKSAEDYIVEDQRNRSPGPSARTTSTNLPYPGIQATYVPFANERQGVHYSTAAQRASTRCMQDAAAMFDTLAQSFEQELRDKERDIMQAQALLSNIQSEILDSQRAVGQLRLTAESLADTKQQLDTLKEELTDKISQQYRVGWEQWVREEEAREKGSRDTNGHVPPTDPVLNGNTQDTQEDDADIKALYEGIPADPEALKQAIDALRAEVKEKVDSRRGKLESVASGLAESGTGGHMTEYRRLIGAGCGGVPPAEVDHVLGMLLETLESEEPATTQTQVWNASTTAATTTTTA